MTLVKLQIALFPRSYNLDQNALQDLTNRINILNAGGATFQIQNIPFIDVQEFPKLICRDTNFEAVFSSQKFDFYWSEGDSGISDYEQSADTLLNKIRTILEFQGSPQLFSRIGFIRTGFVQGVDNSAFAQRILSTHITETNPTGIKLNYTIADQLEDHPLNRVVTLQSAKLLDSGVDVVFLEEDLNTKQESNLSCELNNALTLVQTMLHKHTVTELSNSVLGI